jgi:hypothetical protein
MIFPTPALCAGACLAALLHAGPPTEYVGRANQLKVAIPRIEDEAADVTVDGVLAESVWSQAAVLSGFSQYTPQDGIPAADSTRVLVWYSASALHVGIRAYEQHAAVHATLADRDKITADDNVQILLGTFNDKRQAYFLAVNPFGIQMDGTLVETTPSGGGGFQVTIPKRQAPDLSQDFVFSSKGRVTDFGYEVEMSIPFRSLKFQGTDVQAWDVNVVRFVAHSGYEDSWAPARRTNTSFLAQGGTLEGLTGLDRGLVLDVNPMITRRSTGGMDPASNRWHYTQPRPQIGMNVRYGVTNNLTLNGTMRPDFAEVESDASQIVFDPRQALYFPEKRPFFLDGLEQFNAPKNLIYTRRIAKPEAALKLTGKAAGLGLGFISAQDDPSLSSNGRYSTIYNILRAQRDIGGQSRVGMAYTDRVVGGDYNRVADVDGRIVFGKVYTASFQYAQSFDKTRDAVRNAPLWDATFSRNGKRYGARYSLNGIHEDFRAGSGFISRPGIVHGTIDERVSWFFPRGQRLESFNLDVLYDNTWQYSHFVHQGDAQDKKFHISTSTGLRGGWTVGASVYWETFGYDTQLFSNYQIERTVGSVVDTIPFVGVGRIPNRDYVASITTPQWKGFDANAVYIFGQDENFFEWAQADIHYLSLTTNFRPSDRLRLAGTLTYQDYWRRTDGSLVGRNAIPRIKTEYQLTRSQFIRLIGEYNSSLRDDLRDETRTFFPLIIGGQRALADRSHSLRGDVLYSYQPNPGTVFFLGYGSFGVADPSLDPLQRFNFQPLVRASDYFFVKYSYLFRI